ncbi:hypothetical protein KQI82_00905 [Oscillibacter sp. MSJ-2]|uniref:Uncharacterized protein n=1 Tax=Dysosmobacter acutus TaxID=2841504 RepID=A0ABS6F5C3_9FIRM|nr:hypothetical protein [Dysosmobacter acutus]MBU5625493.1 hypothetical protein [Dysosmobacter acutus]
MDEQNIPMPGEEEKNRAIAQLLSAGLIAPPGLWRSLGEVRHTVGVRTLFGGVGDCLFLSALTLALCLLPMAAAAQQGRLAPVLFLLSPALYASLHLLTAWKESMSGTLDWKLTCRVSFRAMTALRMLIFGGVSVAVCVPVDGLLWTLAHGGPPLLWMLGLSCSSLFLYGALSLLCQRLRRLPGLLAPPAAWAALGAVPLCSERAAACLTRLPTAVFFLLAAAGLALYLLELRRYCLHHTEGGSAYAFS